MIRLKGIIIVMLIAFATTVNAQDFQGIATYKTQRKIDIKMDSTQMNSEMHTKMMAMMKKQFQKTYKLTFDKSTSLYQQEVELGKPQVGGGEFQVQMIGGGGGSDVLYKNVKDQNYTDQKETMGKKFLIKDSITKIEWKLESDTKYIGEYLCFKATYTKQVPKINHSFSSISNKEDKETEEEPEMEERTISAWYTPQIPVNNGPEKYQGLPGLIMEIHNGKLTIICSRIVLNPEDKIKIEEPLKGKEVNQIEYDKIMDKKEKEMMERYAPSRGAKNGEIHISIGG